MEAKITGVTPEMLAELADKKTILENIKWKPDALRNGKRTFYPYLAGDFVKRRLFEVLGAQNLQFMLEKDEEYFAKGSLGVFMADTAEWNFFSALGVEKEGKGLTDVEKKNKVKFKGNVTDTIKSCAEWLGVCVPAGVTSKTLVEKDKKVYSGKGVLVGSIYDNEAVSSHLNGLSQTRYLLAKVYQLNKEAFTGNERLMENLKQIMEDLKDGK